MSESCVDDFKWIKHVIQHAEVNLLSLDKFRYILELRRFGCNGTVYTGIMHAVLKGCSLDLYEFAIDTS